MLLLLAACRVVDAPDDAQQLAVFGFVNADGPRAFPEAFFDSLVPWADESRDALAGGFWVDSLTADDLGAVGIDVDPDVEVVGAMGVAAYDSTLDQIARAVTHPHLEEVFSGTLSYEQHTEDDRDCFLTRACETFRFSADRVVRMGLLGDATQSITALGRWVEHADGHALLLRTLAPDRALTGPLLQLDQQYLLSAFYDDGSARQRVDVVWAEASLIGIDLPDRTVVDLAVSNMESAASQIDAWTPSGG